MNENESSGTSDTESSHEDGENNFVLMAVENLEQNCIEYEINDEDATVDMEGELMSALEEIDRLRLKKRKQKQLLV